MAKENTSPNKTFAHSPPLTPSRLLCIAIAEPVSPAMRAWLSLVGIPNAHASTAHTTIANIAAHKAMSASRALEPKSTILYIVSATFGDNSVITSTPRKLKTAAMIIAARGFNARVATQLAMALGASVHPLTRMTPSVKSTVTQSAGVVDNC